MELVVTNRHAVFSDEARETVVRRLRFALARFEPEIERVVVTGQDQNGPKGGPDKQCRVAAHLVGGDVLTVTDEDADIVAAVSRAADRLARAVGRALERARSRRSYTSYGGPAFGTP